MKVKLLLLCALAFASSALAATLSITSLDKNQTTQLLQGNTMTVGPSAILKGRYVNDTIHVYFGPNGMLVGKWIKPMAGVPEMDKGTWAANDKLCVKWDKWGTSCITLYPMERGYLVVDDNKEVLFIPKSNITSGNTVGNGNGSTMPSSNMSQ